MTPQAPPTSSWLLTEASLDWLKLIAMILMVLDHTNESLMGDSTLWMYWLGRGAYPLFAYAMACHLIKRPRLDGYLKRLLVFALLSQPFFVLASYENCGNVLFTLACGAIAGAWVIGEAHWRRHLLCGLALVSFFFKDFLDFGMAGVMLPAAIACVFRRDPLAWPWLIALTILLNATFGDFFGMDEGAVAFTSFTYEDVVPALVTLLLPLAILAVCRQIQGTRFLPRYALYLFYPAHLCVLAIARVWTQPLPPSLFF